MPIRERRLGNTMAETSGNSSTGIRKGTPGYVRASIAMLAAGLATFSTLYSTQAILPSLSSHFGIDPTTAALTVSAVTGLLAVCVVPASILSEKVGRGRMLVASAFVATVCGIALPFATSIWLLIALRALQGIALAGVPAVAMTWINEEIDRRDVTHAMGLYIAGNSLGGIFGRLLPAIGVDFFDSWRVGLGINAGFGFILAVTMLLILPPQKRFTPHPINPKRELRAMIDHWRNPTMAKLFGIAFLNMGVFVSFYNYVGFRMTDTFGLSPALVGVLFLLYLSGTWSAARAGAWSKRWGQQRVMVASAAVILTGFALCLSPWLAVMIVGTLAFTASFFLLHSLASSWVGSAAGENRSEASSMYLLCYYVGSSVLGWVSGYVFSHFEWTGLMSWLLAWSVGLILLTLTLTGPLKERVRLVRHG